MTKKILPISLLIGAQLLFSPAVFSQKTIEECETEKQSPEKESRCFDEVKDTLDRELQTWINNHVFILEEKSIETGRSSALKMFKRSQNDFITFRDNNCRWQYLAISPNKGANKAYKKCYITVTQSRINELSNIP